MGRNSMIDDDGFEVLSPEPVAIPAHLKRPLTLAEQVRQSIRTEFSRMAADSGFETFEEADDFVVGDDYDPTSPYEMDFDQEVYSDTGNQGGDDRTPQDASSGAGKGEQEVRGGRAPSDQGAQGPTGGDGGSG